MESNSEDKNYDDMSDVIESASASSDRDTYINPEQSVKPEDNSYLSNSTDIAKLDETGESDPAEEDNEDKKKLLENTKVFKWHWILVFIVSAIAIYISIANGASLEFALKRALYCTAIFWIIAEAIDFVIYKMR